MENAIIPIQEAKFNNKKCFVIKNMKMVTSNQRRK